VLYQGRLRIFDGIEFNPNLRWIDVISEIAFCCMDLDDHQHSDLGFRLLNQYLAHTGDYEGLGVMRYYLVYRALVRAKVACIRLLQEHQEHTRTPAKALDFKDYFALAYRYTRPENATLLITHGFSGSGKSTITLPLAIDIHAIHIRSDRERQRLYPQQNHTTSGIGKGIYSSDATHNTYARLALLAGAVLDAGYSVIIDATFLKHKQRQQFQQLAQQLSTPLLILDFTATPEELRYRIRERELRNQDISEANLEVLEHQLESHEPLTETERGYTLTVDTGKEIVYEELVRGIRVLRECQSSLDASL
jgi:predicted kinase